MAEQTLAQKWRAKYGSDYDDLDDQQLEAMIDKKYPGDYDDIPRTQKAAPTKPQRSLLSRGISAAISPINALSRASQRVANVVEGVDRPVHDAHKVEVEDDVGGVVRQSSGLLNPMKEGNLLTAPLEAIYAAQQAIPGAVESLAQEPIATLRGGAAGVIEGVGQMSPFDFATILAGRLAGRARSSPGSAVKSGPRPVVETAPPTAPEAFQGARLRRERPTAAQSPTDMQTILTEIVEEGKRPTRAQNPSTIEPPAPSPEGLILGPDGKYRPAPEGKYTVKAGKTPKRGGDEVDESGAPRVTGKLPRKKAEPKKPEAKISDLTEDSTIKEVAEAVNAVARKEPEVLAKRVPELEELAENMEGGPRSPNRAVNEALQAETLRGASGKVVRKREPGIVADDVVTKAMEEHPAIKVGEEPITRKVAAARNRPEATPLQKQFAEEAVEGAARVRGSDADIPDNPTAKKLEADRQAIARGELVEEIPKEELVPVRHPRPDDVPETVAPQAAKARTEFEAAAAINNPSPVPKLPPMKAPKAAKAGAVEEVPVTKVPAAQTKGKAAALPENLSNLSASEQIRITKLHTQVPEAVRSAVANGAKLPKMTGDVAEKAADYQALYRKTQAAPAAPKPPKVDVPKLAASDPLNKVIHDQIADMETKRAAAGARLPADLRKALDEGTSTEGLLKREHVDDLFAYTGWRDRIEGARARIAQAKEIDDVATANMVAAAKAAGREAPKPSSVVARSEEVAQKLALPSAPVAEIKPKAIAAAVDESLKLSSPRRMKLEAEEAEDGLNFARPMRKEADEVEDHRLRFKPTIRPYLTRDDIGVPPKGVSEKMWRTAHANAREAGRLFKERQILDPRVIDVARRFFGSEQAAKLSGIPRELIEEASTLPAKRKPMEVALRELDEELDRRYKFAMEDPKGFIRAEALLAGAGAITGASVGAMLGGESVEDRFAAAVSLMLMGGLGAYGSGKAIANAGKLKNKGKNFAAQTKANIEALDSANLLAGPAAIKASLGAGGGIAAGVWQRLREGRKADAVRGMKFMAKEAPGMWLNVFKGPMGSRTMQKQGALTSGVQKQAGKIPTFILNQVLRPFVASDTVGKTALRRMGFTEEESLRLMMNGEPTSAQGQMYLRAINSMWVTRMLMKFPRVRIGSLERGVEFTPGLSGRFNTRKGHNAEQLTKQQLRARAEFGAGAIAFGTAYGYFADPGFMEAGVGSALAGPAFLPMAAGIAFGKGLKKGDVVRAVRDAAVEVGSAAPQVSDTNIRSTFSTERWTPGRPLRRGLAALGIGEEP